MSKKNERKREQVQQATVEIEPARCSDDWKRKGAVRCKFVKMRSEAKVIEDRRKLLKNDDEHEICDDRVEFCRNSFC